MYSTSQSSSAGRTFVLTNSNGAASFPPVQSFHLASLPMVTFVQPQVQIHVKPADLTRRASVSERAPITSANGAITVNDGKAEKKDEEDASIDAEIKKAEKMIVLARLQQEKVQAELHSELLRQQVEALRIQNDMNREQLKIMQSGMPQKLQELEAQALLVQAGNQAATAGMHKQLLAHQLEIAQGNVDTLRKEKAISESTDKAFLTHHKNSMFF